MLAKGPPDRAAVRTDPSTYARAAVGLHVLSAETATALFHVLHRRVRDERRVGEGYEAALAEVIRDGAELHPIDLRELSCVAVDSRDDLHRARRIFGPPFQSSSPESITTSHSFFGGPDSGAPSTGK
jgi:choline kinase